MTISRSRAGKGFIKFLAIVIIVAVVMSIGWVMWSARDWHFWRKENLDKGLDDAQQLAARSQEVLDSLKEKTWGKDGLVDDMRDWLRSRPKPAPSGDDTDPTTGTVPPATEATPPTADQRPPATADRRPPADDPPTTVPPPGPIARGEPSPITTTSEATKRLARRIAVAEDTFATGLDHYDRANPAIAGSSNQTFAEVRLARDAFAQVRDILHDTILAYEQRPDHHPRTLASAKELQQRNQKMLANANKMVR